VNCTAAFVLGLLFGAVALRPDGARAPTPSGNPALGNHRRQHMLSKFQSALRGNRKRRIASTSAAFVLVAATSALAAWIIYSGASGTGTVQGDTAQTVDVLKLTPDPLATDKKVSPGATDVNVYAKVQNVGQQSARLKTLTATVASDDPACNIAGITFQPEPSVVNAASGQQFVAGATATRVPVGQLVAASSADPDCAGDTFTLTFAGTTAP
jgi:hypothetical protein